MVGLGDGPDAEGPIWALAGLQAALPEASYRLAAVPGSADPTSLALGWALATYVFARYSAKTRPAPALVWPEAADRGRVERLAAAVFLARDLANTPAGGLGPEELAGEARRVAQTARPRHRVTVGDALRAAS